MDYILNVYSLKNIGWVPIKSHMPWQYSNEQNKHDLHILLEKKNGEHGPGDYHAKWSKSDRERQIYDIAYMWTLKKKKNTHELIYKTETDSQT